MKCGFALVLALSLLLVICPFPVSADSGTIGGDQGWYVIHCNVYGANVYFDDKFVGTVQMGTLTIPASTTGTPYKTIRVQKYGYSTFVDSITQVPGQGESVDLYATLNQLPLTTQTSVGGDMGWYVVHCNIEGAHVQFDGSDKGDITQGVVYVPVYSTGTPYQGFTVEKDGFTPYKGTISNVPGKGETIDLYATLNPVATTVATPVTTGTTGGDIGYYAVHANVDGADVSFDNDVKGQISMGRLVVPVYVTGTPYKMFAVYKEGYIPFTGAIDQYPKKGETIDLNATLSPAASVTTAVPSATQKSSQSVVPGLLSIVFVVYVMALGPRK
jgi:hypothetical protein